MIYFVTPDMATPSGGIKMIYNFVEMLNKNNIEAKILHRNNVHTGWEGRAVWFEHDHNLVPIHYSYVNGVENRLKITEEDILVVPEGYGIDIVNKYSKVRCKKVVFAQSWSYIIPSFGYNEQNQKIQNWKNGGFNDVIVTSDVIEDTVKFLFGYTDDQIHRCSPFVDDVFNNTFKFGSYSQPIQFLDKEKVIVFNPRKNGERYNQIFTYLLHSNPVLFNTWRPTPITDLKQEGVIDILKRSAIFLTASLEEGFGLPIVEAFRTNTIAVGHTGVGANEFWTDPLEPGFSDPTNSIINTAIKLKEAIDIFDKEDETKWNEIIQAQFEISERYTKERTEKQVVNTFKKINEKKLEQTI